jgi:dGTPase
MPIGEETMQWRRLLSRRRLEKDGQDPENPYRSAFEIDIDRITFSTSFRRLADKQQVHGIGGSDYVRSRLTHSMEAARVGRSLGAWVGREIVSRYGGEEAVGADAFDIGHIVSAAALAHDLGTPCFAHTGEDVISDWFASAPLGRRVVEGLSSQQAEELRRFEGNAQGFRLLTRLQGWRAAGGLQLTCATLGAYSKYPWSAPAFAGQVRPHPRKYGFFASETSLMAAAAAELGLIPGGPDAWHRHPLAYLVEAADDACYSVVDIEDAVKMRMLTFAEAEELLAPLIDWDRAEYRAIEGEGRRLIYLRARAIDRLVGDAATAFLDQLSDIMHGKPCLPLLGGIERRDALQEIERVSYARIYRGQQRCETDIVAARTVTILLDAYAEALLAREAAGKGAAGKGADLPRRLASLLELLPDHRAWPYERGLWAQALVDYIAGMTDRFAIRQAELIGG